MYSLATTHDTLRMALQRVSDAQVGVHGDVQALQLALVSATREPPSLAGYVLPTAVLRRVVNYAALKLAVDELGALYGVHTEPSVSTGIDACTAVDAFQTFERQLRTALRCTLQERLPAAAWSSPTIRTAAYLAVHLEEPVAALGALLGGVVHSADSRRVEDIAAQIDDDEPQTMLLGNVVVALAEVAVLRFANR